MRFPFLAALAACASLGATGLSGCATVNAAPDTSAMLPVPAFHIDVPGSAAGAMLARRHAQAARSCGGDNVSFPLSWSAPPSGTRSLALSVYDPDGRQGAGVVHWLRYGIRPDIRAIGEGQGTEAGLPGVGGRNTAAANDLYAGPCPPIGETAHHYVVQLFALDLAPDALPPSLTREAFLAASRGHVLGYTSIVLRYAR